MVLTYSHAKVQGHRSVSSEDRVETNGRTDGRMDGQRRLHCLPHQEEDEEGFTWTTRSVVQEAGAHPLTVL